MKKPLLALALSATVITTFAQKQADVWHFGLGRSIDFSSGEPELVAGSQIASYEGTASYCDASGNLLFYSDGASRIWNVNNEVMYEIQDDEGGGYSAMQPGVVIEVPGECGVYYFFTMDELEVYPNGNGLRYFTIDMNANGGLGAVLASTEVFTPSFEGICAIRHSNGSDYWIVINQASLGLGVYSVTENGVALSSIFPVDQLGTKGCIKASPDGSHVFVKAAEGEPFTSLSLKGLLFEFDNTSGVLSNLQELVAQDYFFYFEFSPNSNWLYVNDFTSLARFDLQAADISASVTYLFPELQSAGGGCQMQLGPDGNLYWVYVVYDPFTGNSTISIERVLQPDAADPIYDPAVFSFPSAENNYVEFIGLPNFPAWIFGPVQPVDIFSEDSLDLCAYGQSLILDTQLENGDFIWSTGADTPSITVTGPGTYSVEINALCLVASDEIVVTEECFGSLEGAEEACLNTEVSFSLTEAAQVLSVTWDFGDVAAGADNTSDEISPVHVYTQPGSFQVTATAAFSFGTTTFTSDITISDCAAVTEACNIWVPNAFTPNDDGVNDVFVPVADCAFDTYSLRILNRWGQTVFNTDDPGVAWVGNVEGGEYFAQDGVYQYQITYRRKDAQTNVLRGSLMLMR